MPDYRLRKNRKTSEPRTAGVRLHHLWWIRGLLIVREQRDVSWGEIAQLTGIPIRTMRHLLDGEFVGGPLTIKRLLTLRDYGLMIHLSDFESPEPVPAPKPIPKLAPLPLRSPHRK